MKKLLLGLMVITCLYACNNTSPNNKQLESPEISEKKEILEIDIPQEYLEKLSDSAGVIHLDRIIPMDGQYHKLTQKQKKIVMEALEPPKCVQGYCPHIIGLNNKNERRVVINNKPYYYEYATLYEGKVCIEAKAFSGYPPYNIPFVMRVFGQVSAIYVDGKKVNEYKGKNGEVFFRKKIALEMGYNRIPVKIVGNSGNITEGYIEQNIESVPEQIQILN